MSLFDQMLKSKEYQKIIETIPENEREDYLKALKTMVDNFESRILIPIKNLKRK